MHFPPASISHLDRLRLPFVTCSITMHDRDRDKPADANKAKGDERMEEAGRDPQEYVRWAMMEVWGGNLAMVMRVPTSR